MSMTIGGVAAGAGLTADTVRYYERIGLLPEPERTPSGYRTYGPDTAERLRFIKGAQSLGLRLDEIRQLVRILDRGLCPCGHTRLLLTRRIDEVDEELSRLTALKGAMARALEETSACDPGDTSQVWQCSADLIGAEMIGMPEAPAARRDGGRKKTSRTNGEAAARA